MPKYKSVKRKSALVEGLKAREQRRSMPKKPKMGLGDRIKAALKKKSKYNF